MSRHTPGPYEVGESAEGDVCIYTSDTTDRVGGDPIAVLCKEVGGHPMPWEANARILKAAPRMYDVLVAIERDFHQVPDWLQNNRLPGWAWDRIQLALADARGEIE